MTEYVYVGAGSLGAKLAFYVRPVAFADRDPAKIGTDMGGIPCLSIPDAIAAYPDATFVVTIWHSFSTHRIRDTEAALRDAGVRSIVPFGAILRQRDGAHYFIGSVGEVMRDARAMMEAGDLWSDAASRERYSAEVFARFAGDVSRLADPVPGPTYFPDDLFTYRHGDEIVLDGGAYDGDTLRAFMAAGGAFGRWIAFEPHPVIGARFVEKAHDLLPYIAETVECWQAALSNEHGETWFTDDATTGAAAVDANDVRAVHRVATIRIDDFAPTISPTFVKLDIEGAELDALAGMADTIRRCRPVVAVCVYHRPTDLWRIPLALRDLMPDAKFYLRSHDGEGWDTVCYAVPPERAL